MPNPKSTVTLAVAWLTIFFAYMLAMIVSPLLDLIMSGLRLSFVEAGLVVSTPAAMIASFSILGGWLGDKYGYKPIVTVAICMMGAGSFLRSESTTLLELLATSAVFGIGIAFVYPNLPKMIRALFPSRMLGTATGVYSTGIAFGSFAAFALAKPVMLPLFGGWRNEFAFLGIMTLVPLLAWLGFAFEPETAGTRMGKTSTGGIWASMSSPTLMLASLVMLFSNVIFYGYVGWLPTFLSSTKELPALTNSLMTSLMFLAQIPGILLLPIFSDMVGLRRPFLVAFSALTGIMSAEAILPLPTQLLWITLPLLGFVLGGWFSILLTLPSELVPGAASVGMAAGVMLSVGFVGSFVGAPLVGYLRDVSGGFTLGFLSFVLLSSLSIVASFMLPETGRRASRMATPTTAG